MSKDEKKFGEFIKMAGTDEAPQDFAHNVMKAVQSAAENQTATELRLSAILKRTALESPSLAFSENVMADIGQHVSKKETPIISQKIWYLIAACFTGLLLYSIFPVNQSQVQSTSLLVRTFDHFLTRLTPEVNSVPLQYPLALIAISMLVLGDYFLRQRVNSFSKL